jgi:hypothetical protein
MATPNTVDQVAELRVRSAGGEQADGGGSGVIGHRPNQRATVTVTADSTAG